MRGDRTFGSFRSLLFSTALSTFCLLSAQSVLASDLKPAATLTLADMASRAETQLARPVPASQAFVPLASVGAKGGMPRAFVPRRVEELADDRSEPAGEAPEPYDARLSRIVSQMRDDLAGDQPAAPQSQSTQVAGGNGPLPDLAAEAAAVPDELVFRLQERSKAGPAEEAGERRFTLVMPAPQADDPRRVDVPEEVSPPAAATDDSAELRATGMTLADMAMEATPAPPKQARGRPNLPGVPLARLVAPSGGTTWAAPRQVPRAAIPAPRASIQVLPAPRQRPRAGLSFADPRGLTERFLQGTMERPWEGSSEGADHKVWQYPASASLARFLGEMERLPTPMRRHGGRVPLNLEQVARSAEEAGTNTTWMGRPNPGFTFSFSREAFAANQLTTGPYGARRQAVMDELRRVFAPLR